MEKLITINKLTEQIGLTSRTLRYWESEGLFESERDFVPEGASIMKKQFFISK